MPDQRERASASRRRILHKMLLAWGSMLSVRVPAILGGLELVSFHPIAQARSSISQLGKIALKIRSYINWFKWASAAGQEISKGNPPPARDALIGDKLVDKLNETKRELTQLSPPSFGTNLLSVGNLPNEPAAVRDHLSIRERAFQSAAHEYVSLEDEYFSGLGEIEDALNELLGYGSVTSDALLELTKAAVFPPIAELVLGEALNLSLEISPLIKDCLTQMLIKKKEADEYFRSRRDDLWKNGHDLLNVLALESAALSGEASILAQSKQRLSAHEAAFEKEEKALQRLAVLIRARAADIRSLGEAMEADAQEIQRLRDQQKPHSYEIKRIDEWLRNWESNYNSCPEGQPFDRCTHTGLKKAFVDNEKVPRESHRQQLSGQNARLSRLIDVLDLRIADSRQTRESYVTLLAGQTDEYDRRSAEHASSGADLERERRSVFERAWTSKVDLYAEASKRAEIDIRKVLGDLK